MHERHSDDDGGRRESEAPKENTGVQGDKPDALRTRGGAVAGGGESLEPAPAPHSHQWCRVEGAYSWSGAGDVEQQRGGKGARGEHAAAAGGGAGGEGPHTTREERVDTEQWVENDLGGYRTVTFHSIKTACGAASSGCRVEGLCVCVTGVLLYRTLHT